MATDVELRLVISAINRAGVQLNQVGDQLKSVSTKAADLAASSAKVGTVGVRGVKRFGQALDSLKPKFEAIGRASDRLVSAGMQLGQVGAGLLAAAVFPIAKATTFQKAMSDVRAVTAGTAEDFAALSEKAKVLGATTEWTAKQAAGGIEFLGMAGMNATEALEAIGPALLLASAGGLELASAADIATNILKGLGLETEELTNVVDILAYTANNSNQRVGELGEAFSYAAPFVQQAGMEIEKASAMLAQLADAGVRSTRGGTALRGVILGLAKVTPLAQKAFDRLNVSVSKNADGTINYLQTLRDLNEAGATGADWADIFTRSFGGLASLLARNADETEAFAEALKDVSGVAKETAEVRLANLWGALKKLTSALDGLATSMGEPLLKSIEAFVDKVTAAATAARNWADANPELAGSITGIAAAVGGLLVAVAAVLIPLGLLGKLLAMVGQGLGTWVAAAARAGQALAGLRAVLFGVNVMATQLGRAFVALGLTMAAWDIYRVIQAFVDWRKAEAEAADAAQRLREQGDLLIKKFEKFKDIPLPETEDLLEKTKVQLVAMNNQLMLSLMYWQGIQRQLKARAEEKKFWLFETKGAKAAKAELAAVNEKLEDIGEARGQLLKAMKAGEIEAGIDVDLILDPKQLTELQSEILEAMDGVGEGITKSISRSFELIDADPMIKELAAAQVEISRDTKLAGEKRTRLVEKIEKDIAGRRLSLVQTSLNNALTMWSKYGERQTVLASAALEARLIDAEQYAARVGVIAEDIAQKKMQALAKVRQYLERDLSKSLAAEQKFADKIKSIQEDVAGFHESAQEKIRSVRRRGMSDEEAYADKVSELNEKMAEAQALDPGQYEKAKGLFRDVMNTASSLVGEIEEGGRVLVTEQESMETVIDLIGRANEGIAAAGKQAGEETALRLEEQQKVTQNLLATLDAVAAKFDLLARTLQQVLNLKINADVEEIDTAIAKMQGLEEEKDWCDRLFDEPFVVKIDTDAVADVGDAVRAEAREVAQSPIDVQLEDNVVDVEENIKGALARIQEAGESIPVDLSTVSSIEELERLAQEVYMVQEETGKPLHFVGISTGDLEASIANIGLFKEVLAGIGEEPIKVAVETTGEEEVKGLTESLCQVVDKEAEVEATVIGYDEVSKLAEIINGLENKTIIIRGEFEQSAWPARREGGLIGAAGGGLMPDSTWHPTPAGRKVPGTGTKDSVLAMLAPKEYVLCAAAVREYGLAFVQSLNRRMLDLGAFYKFQTGGSAMDAVKSPPPRLVQLHQTQPRAGAGGAAVTTVNRKDFNINISMAGGRAPKLSGKARRLLDQLSDEMDFLATRGANFG